MCACFVIDDCSPDDNAEVARQIWSEGRPGRIPRHPENAGNIRDLSDEGLLEWAGGD